ncbi:SUF system Fe-S cluster assembly protein [Thiohalobacter thiocyanaticus]|uniref:SUF system Fe-S cluster assembly protein n=2 Tax=Thiohalobacter thiocyanaticus TaxID=585455 RepID=A0A426QM69_9GAMM|nr:SUF system Fe-S cluster assembly protein [Thiohalobacter thiocyanaticus]RRQ22845.1 SUF system Fe-S cluster assembly protein [Thiohalobacter thiocyanaticus]
MSEALKPVEHYRELIDAARSSLPGAGQPWLDARRQAAAARFTEQGFPTRKAEEWRYSNIGQVLEQPFRYRDEAFEALTDSDIEDLLLVEQPAARLVFANGRLVPHLSMTADLDPSVSLISLRDAIDSDSEFVNQWLGQAIIDADLETFEALNTALLNDGMCLHIPAGVSVEQPIEVLYLSVGLDEPSVMTPRNLIVLDQGARARLVEQYASTTDAPYFNNGLTEIILGEDAELEHDRLQDEAAQAYHMSVIHLAQAGRSRYRGMVASLGGTWARTEYHTAFSGEEANCDLAGFYFAGDGQLTDIHLDVRHPVPRCNSEQKFKGILAGKGKAVLDGRIRGGQGCAADRGASVQRHPAAVTRCRGRYQAAAGDLRRRRQVQPRHHRRPARSHAAVLPAHTRHQCGYRAQDAVPGLRRRGAGELHHTRLHRAGGPETADPTGRCRHRHRRESLIIRKHGDKAMFERIARFIDKEELDQAGNGGPDGDTPLEVEGDTLEERVIAALRTVYDPEIPVNLYDLGLIYKIVIHEASGKVDIDMTLTAPACPVAGSMPGMVANAVRRLEEVNEVNVELVWDPPWTMDRMSDEARLELGML